MTSEITYKLNKSDLDQVLTERLAELQTTAVLGRFKDRLISVDTVAEIHGIHRETVTKYAAAKLIPHQRDGKLYKFSLYDALLFDFNELRRRG